MIIISIDRTIWRWGKWSIHVPLAPFAHPIIEQGDSLTEPVNDHFPHGSGLSTGSGSGVLGNMGSESSGKNGDSRGGLSGSSWGVSGISLGLILFSNVAITRISNSTHIKSL